MTDLVISENTRVTLNFALYLSDGSEVDSNFDSQPVSFAVGDGSLLPGFERALFGLTAGDEGEFQITPENAFGQPNELNIQTMPRHQFEGDEGLERGMVFSFADASGAELPGMVVAVTDDEVTVDFNHPLAGRTITFKVFIHHVEAAELH